MRPQHRGSEFAPLQHVQGRPQCPVGIQHSIGETLEEVRANLSEAIQLILETNREEFEKQYSPGAKVTREQLVLRAA